MVIGTSYTVTYVNGHDNYHIIKRGNYLMINHSYLMIKDSYLNIKDDGYQIIKG